ncbi:hypothetical protein AB1E19_001643 [Capra hircus]
MGLISPGGENFLDFLELRQVLSTYDGDLRDPLWKGQSRSKTALERERHHERLPSNSHGEWPFLRPPKRVPEVPVKYPKIHVSTGEESSGSGTDSTQGLRPRHRRERNPERPPSNSHGDWPFLRPPERVPEVPVKYPKIHVSTGEESSGSGTDSTQGLRPRHLRERNPERPPSNSHGHWPFLRPPEQVPEVPVICYEIFYGTGTEIVTLYNASENFFWI